MVFIMRDTNLESDDCRNCIVLERELTALEKEHAEELRDILDSEQAFKNEVERLHTVIQARNQYIDHLENTVRVKDFEIKEFKINAFELQALFDALQLQIHDKTPRKEIP